MLSGNLTLQAIKAVIICVVRGNEYEMGTGRTLEKICPWLALPVTNVTRSDWTLNLSLLGMTPNQRPKN